MGLLRDRAYYKEIRFLGHCPWKEWMLVSRNEFVIVRAGC
jgi:hypothetical protein